VSFSASVPAFAILDLTVFGDQREELVAKGDAATVTAPVIGFSIMALGYDKTA
jgi:hypothetical protein